MIPSGDRFKDFSRSSIWRILQEFFLSRKFQEESPGETSGWISKGNPKKGLLGKTPKFKSWRNSQKWLRKKFKRETPAGKPKRIFRRNSVNVLLEKSSNGPVARNELPEKSQERIFPTESQTIVLPEFLDWIPNGTLTTWPFFEREISEEPNKHHCYTAAE